MFKLGEGDDADSRHRGLIVSIRDWRDCGWRLTSAVHIAEIPDCLGGWTSFDMVCVPGVVIVRSSVLVPSKAPPHMERMHMPIHLCSFQTPPT